nr:hypothetical protein Iba_chr10cCG2410 [Ipomoea batatas]
MRAVRQRSEGQKALAWNRGRLEAGGPTAKGVRPKLRSRVGVAISHSHGERDYGRLGEGPKLQRPDCVRNFDLRDFRIRLKKSYIHISDQATSLGLWMPGGFASPKNGEASSDVGQESQAGAMDAYHAYNPQT